METSEKPVLLRPGKDAESQEFSAKHAERLLKYPGSLWTEVAAETKTPAKAIAASASDK